ncbi:hypothetical protein HY637_04730 [Candidatus Woesearchaeota archaeon]|nr:hypothetical protein [Candidatus Woesearchaeota archaeon]
MTRIDLTQKIEDVRKVPGLEEHLKALHDYQMYRGLAEHKEPTGCPFSFFGPVVFPDQVTGHARLLDLQVNPDEKTAAYIVELDERIKDGLGLFSGYGEGAHIGFGGTGRAVVVGVYADGRNALSAKYVFQDMFQRENDNPALFYKKITQFAREGDKIKIEVASEAKTQTFKFKLVDKRS